MAITEEKDIREVRLEKSAGQVRIVVDTVILRDGEEILRTPGNEVYTQETAQQLRDEVTNGAEYATLMGW
jgi:hypothetical protein